MNQASSTGTEGGQRLPKEQERDFCHGCVESEDKRWVTNTAELKAEVLTINAPAHSCGLLGFSLTVTIVLCRNTGIFGVFLACRKSLKAVEERKTVSWFFFLKGKKCCFFSCKSSAGTWAVGMLPSAQVLRGEGSALVDNSGKLLALLSETARLHFQPYL